MPGEILGYCFSGKVATATEGLSLEGTAYTISSADAYGVPILVAAAAAGRLDGVLLRAGKANEVLRFVKEGIVMMKAGAAIAAIGEVELGADGVVAKSAGVAIGKVLSTAGGVNELVPVFLY